MQGIRSTAEAKASWGGGGWSKGQSYTTNFVVQRIKKRRSLTRRNENKSEERRVRTHEGWAFQDSYNRSSECENTRRSRTNRPSILRNVPTCKRNEQENLRITSLYSGCSAGPLAPTVVPLVVASSEDLGFPEAGCIHSQRGPSLVVRRKDPVEADWDTGDEHKCSGALGELGEGGCGIVAAIRSWSFEVAHRTSVQTCSWVAEQEQGWVHSASGGTGEEQHGCLRQSYWRGEGSSSEQCQNRVEDVCWPYPCLHAHRPHLFDHQARW